MAQASQTCPGVLGREGYRGQAVGCAGKLGAESVERVSHKALACGDLLTEEAHDAMLDEFSASVRE